ncbi:DUF3644 domain-containing protein [Phytohabitans suffuscus]|uniref:DUF3644 domain-containing protein n=1 Tax=Phytohabitans suffuscus TaxID=624315 RepID=UPI0018D5E0A7|nr:DUF3644 domain-containing protein [Phytohabitans suffuscus]
MILDPNAKEVIMAWPLWRHMLRESQRHALRAVDEWNSSNGNYSDFIGHMHKAWLYLLHAEFRRDKLPFHYTDDVGQPKIIDGESQAWGLEDCLKKRYSDANDPVRRNVELFVKLRNKIEHRYERELKIATGGKAQALVINYEQEMTAKFGEVYSLADQLRFPIFLRALSAEGVGELREISKRLPRRTRDLVARYESDLDRVVLEDLRYDYRIRLVPMVGPKSDADLAVNFVRLDELTEDERKVMVDAGRSGTVIVRDRQVEVTDKDKLRPMQVVRLVEGQVPFEFTLYGHHTEMWRRLGVRPPNGAAKPWETDPRYCVYSEAFGAYVYTTAWVKRIVKEIGTVEKYRAFFGREPRMKVSQLPNRNVSPSITGSEARKLPA